MVPADSRRIPRVPRYSGYRYAGTDFGYGPLTLYRGAFQRLPLACATCNVPVLQPPGRVATPWVWALPRSLATTGGIILLFSLPAGTNMFQFPALALLPEVRVTVLQTARLSHSEIRGSKAICAYPRLIAAYHVLHRLREPRHPPCALIYFLTPAAQALLKSTLRHKGTYFRLHCLCYSLACPNISKILPYGSGE